MVSFFFFGGYTLSLKEKIGGALTYQTLKKTFYTDPTSQRFQNHDAEAARRLGDPSTFRTGITLEHGELFCAMPRELSLASEQVIRRERDVSELWGRLPRTARGAFLRSLILDEVVCSNEMEGVHSTRKQVEVALEAGRATRGNNVGAAEATHAPFFELAQLYLGLTDNPVPPQSLQEIRTIYDSVVKDSIDEKDLVGDTLFRTGPVVIEKRGGRVVHRGVEPEARIEELLGDMISLSKRDDVPELCRAALCHFLFEYVHPFYDGNGRTGRYLLALQLSHLLSQPTVLSLCHTISEHKSAYYKAFDTTEDRLNCSEGTHFVLMLLELVSVAQEDLIADLSEKHLAVELLEQRLANFEAGSEGRGRRLLGFAAERELFSLPDGFTQREACEHLGVSTPTARKELERLEAKEMLARTTRRPSRYVLTPQAKELLGLSAE